MTDMDIMRARPDVLLLDRAWESRLLSELARLEWRVFALEGGDSPESFCLAAKKVLPMDPPISGAENWNALLDSLSGGIDELGAMRTAIVWKDADLLLANDHSSFSKALMVLTDVADRVRKERKKGTTKASLRSFLLGQGALFGPLAPADLQQNEDG